MAFEVVWRMLVASSVLALEEVVGPSLVVVNHRRGSSFQSPIVWFVHLLLLSSSCLSIRVAIALVADFLFKGCDRVVVGFDFWPCHVAASAKVHCDWIGKGESERVSEVRGL